MTKFKLTIAAMSVLAFGLLTACGDGLKGTGKGQENHEQIKRSEGDAPEAEAPSSVLEDAVAAFRSQVERLESDAPGINRNMSLNIDGMTLLRSDSYADAGNTRSAMTLTMLFSCDSSDDVRLRGTVDLSRLEDGEDIRIDSNDPTYQATIRCTDGKCDGLVLTLERNGPNGLTGTAHYAMEGEVIYTAPHGTLYEYNSVEPKENISNFYEKNTVAWYREQCLLADAERELGTSSTGGATDDIFGGGNSGPTTNPHPPIHTPPTTNPHPPIHQPEDEDDEEDFFWI